MKNHRGFGFGVIALTYIIATLVGITVFNAVNGLLYIRVLLADIAATIVVYIVGLIFNNASIYDPYWSVQPIVIALSLCIYFKTFNAGILMLLFAICLWGLRLTANWAVTFTNLSIQDWRYENFQQTYPRLFPLISLLGIHMFPTLVVFLALLPAIAMIENGLSNKLPIVGLCICLAAIFIQLFADRQMQQFRRHRTDKNQLIRTGLWKYARHPNYLGEILMWWGVYVMMLAVSPQKWVLGVGAVVNTIMFFTVSIPMAEKRNSEKPGYAAYKQETRCLLPIKKA